MFCISFVMDLGLRENLVNQIKHPSHSQFKEIDYRRTQDHGCAFKTGERGI